MNFILIYLDSNECNSENLDVQTLSETDITAQYDTADTTYNTIQLSTKIINYNIYYMKIRKLFNYMISYVAYIIRFHDFITMDFITIYLINFCNINYVLF